MIKNITNCKACIKSDVCSIRGNFGYAVNAIAETNTINEDRAIFTANDNPIIEVNIKCTKFMEILPITR
jgi:hypothetical protein